ncbi:MAG: hypothetical protein RLZZ555_272 [Pseudomonadota bacterium]|jgi:hypothetical protein
MAATINYPAELPLPLRSGYGMNHVSPMMRTDLESGRARQRRRYTSVPSIASVSWVMTQSEAQLFEAWFRWTLSDGAEWFNATLRTPLGLRPYECRFAGMYSGPDLVGVDRWQFSADLEIRDRQTLSVGWDVLPSFVVNADIFDTAVNREMPQ